MLDLPVFSATGGGGGGVVPRVTRSAHAKKNRGAPLARARGTGEGPPPSKRRARGAVMKGGGSASRDRRNRKRDFRRLWITRINAAARKEGMSYSEFMHGLREAGVEVDRKMLADLAVRDPEGFRRFTELAREAVAA